MVIVIGPTPPGTGVIAPATCFTSAYFTSPTSRWPFFVDGSSTRFVPTSITTAPGLTMSPVTNSGFPIATTRISASRVTVLTSRVREWQLDQNAVDPVVRVEALDQGQQVALGGVLGQADGLVVQPRCVAGLPLHADVRGGGGVVAHQHGGESGRNAARAQRADLALELGAHRLAHCGAIDDASGQNPPRGFRGSPRP